MAIHLYTACWNEEAIIPFFLRHYEPLADRIIVYDDNSTDRSVELLRASPKVEVRQFLRAGQSFLRAHQAFFDSCWHGSRGQADWVCLTDLDEFLFQPDWHHYLATQKNANVTAIYPIGYDMVSEQFPAADVDLATTLMLGLRDFHFDKTILFAPDAIDQINYTVGRHCYSPVGRVVMPQDRFMQLRHYKALGFDYLLARTRALASRLTVEDHERGWGAHYLRDDDSIRAQFAEQLAEASYIPSPPLLKTKKETKKKSWWRRH